MKIYLSLPISGLDEQAQRNKALLWKNYFESRGHEVINPFNIYDSIKKYNPSYNQIIRSDLKGLKKCTNIFFLNGWQNSKGCIIEAEFAIERNIKVMFERTIVL